METYHYVKFYVSIIIHVEVNMKQALPGKLAKLITN